MSKLKDKTVAFLDDIEDESLKKEAATDSKSETFSSIMKVSHFSLKYTL